MTMNIVPTAQLGSDDSAMVFDMNNSSSFESTNLSIVPTTIGGIPSSILMYAAGAIGVWLYAKSKSRRY